MMDWIKDLIEMCDDLASGKATIEDSRKKAQALMAAKPEGLTDALLAELDARIAELEK